MKSKRSIAALLAFLGFGIFLNSRFQEVSKVDLSNRLLERSIAGKWEKTVAERKAAALSAVARKDRFELRRLVAVFISARTGIRESDPEELADYASKLSAMPADGLAAVVDELNAAAFPDEERASVEKMIAVALVARCADGGNHDILVHRFLTNCLKPPAPEVAQPLLESISDPVLRAKAMQHLTTNATQ